MTMGRASMTIVPDTSGVDAFLSGLGSELGENVRGIAQAGAQVLYDDVRRNVATLGKGQGNLLRSIYQVYSQTESQPLKPVYHISWAAKKAPHGHLVEFGYLQRYKYYVDDRGNVRPMVRPEMMGKPPPKSGNRNRAALDAYYVPRDGGPKQVMGKAFVRRSADKFPVAVDAMRAKLDRVIASINTPTATAKASRT